MSVIDEDEYYGKLVVPQVPPPEDPAQYDYELRECASWMYRDLDHVPTWRELRVLEAMDVEPWDIAQKKRFESLLSEVERNQLKLVDESVLKADIARDAGIYEYDYCEYWQTWTEIAEAWQRRFGEPLVLTEEERKIVAAAAAAEKGGYTDERLFIMGEKEAVRERERKRRETEHGLTTALRGLDGGRRDPLRRAAVDAGEDNRGAAGAWDRILSRRSTGGDTTAAGGGAGGDRRSDQRRDKSSIGGHSGGFWGKGGRS